MGDINVKFSELENMPVFRKTIVKDHNLNDSDSDSGTDFCESNTGKSSNNYGDGVVQVLRRMFSSEEVSRPDNDMNMNAEHCTTIPQPIESNLPHSTSLMVDDSKMDPDEHSTFEGGDKNGFDKENESIKLSSRSEDLTSTPSPSSFRSMPSEVRETTSLFATVSVPSRDVYMYHLKQDVRDKHGKLQGIANLHITIRGAGVAEFPERKRSMVSYA